MIFKLDDIEDAYIFASMGADFGSYAMLCRDTGKIYYVSEAADMDEEPEDGFDENACIEIPGKRELNLGKYLVFEFVEQTVPEVYDRVRQIFRNRGAYARYKDLLDGMGLLQRWYDFENQKQKEALWAWCLENNIEIADADPATVGAGRQKGERVNWRELTAPCGLDCFNCPMYLANENDELRAAIAKRQGLSFDEAVCSGCRAHGGQIPFLGMNEPCNVYRCISGKGIDFCSECGDFPCDHLHPYADRASEVPHNTKVFNLCLIRKMGLAGWAQEKAKSVKSTYFKGPFKL